MIMTKNKLCTTKVVHVEDKKMTVLLKLQQQIKKRSNARPKSLILYIPAQVRDLMQWEHNTPINMEVCFDAETEKKYIKIYAED